VVVVLVQLRLFDREVVGLAVDLDAGVPLAHEVVKTVLEGTLLVPNNGCTQLRTRALRQ